MLIETQDNVIWYPSIGNKGYVYSDWKQKNENFAWETLGYLIDIYDQICRMFRKVYKWSPDIVDKITLSRLIKIKDETIEDNEHRSIEDELE